MKQGFRKLFALFCVLGMSSFGSADTLRVVLYDGGSPPLFFAKGDNNTGIYVDLLMAIGEQSGHQFQFDHLPTKRAMALFEQGQVHVEPGINPVWRSGSKVPGEFTIAFAKAEDVVIFNDGQLKAVTGPQDLNGMKVGTIKGFFYPGYMDAFTAGSLLRQDSLNEDKLMLKLVNNRIDTAFIRKEAAQYRIKTDPKLKTIKIGDVIGSADIMFRVHPSKASVIPAMNQAITELKANGTIETIYSKYR
jgi:polar amino acid transport system substrate-binding protein